MTSWDDFSYLLERTFPVEPSPCSYSLFPAFLCPNSSTSSRHIDFETSIVLLGIQWIQLARRNVARNVAALDAVLLKTSNVFHIVLYNGI